MSRQDQIDASHHDYTILQEPKTFSPLTRFNT